MARKHGGGEDEDGGKDMEPVYGEKYSESAFWEKLKRAAKRVGSEAVFKALQLYYVLQKDDVPKKAKAVVLAALGYFIMPVDLIPDVLPLLGFTDDIALMVTAFSIVARYIDAEVNERARRKMSEWFGEFF